MSYSIYKNIYSVPLSRYVLHIQRDVHLLDAHRYIDAFGKLFGKLHYLLIVDKGLRKNSVPVDSGAS
jgi:hypothetical protein